MQNFDPHPNSAFTDADGLIAFIQRLQSLSLTITITLPLTITTISLAITSPPSSL